MKKHSLDRLVTLTQLRWEKYVRSMRRQLVDSTLDVQADEQHSRPQRFTYGHAPFTSAVVMNSAAPHQILAFEHVDNSVIENTTEKTQAGTPVKSKAKLSHILAFKSMLSYGRVTLRSIAVDQAADAITDIESILRPQWNDLKINFSLWHKTYPIHNKWKIFVSQRVKKRGHFKYPKLHELVESNQFPSSKWKNHFIQCSNKANGDAKQFLKMFLHAPDHWARKYFGDGVDFEDSSADWSFDSDCDTSVGSDFGASGESSTESCESNVTSDSDTDSESSVGPEPIGDAVGAMDLSDEVRQLEGKEDGDPDDVYVFYLRALSLFASKLLKNYVYFLNGADTSQCEAFHFICNAHYPKGSSCSFGLYKMKKTHAAFDWNETQLDKFEHRSPSMPQHWEKDLINDFTETVSTS